MLPRTSRKRHQRSGFRLGFTLVELLVGMAIFSILLVTFTSLVNLVYRAWESSKRQTESSQNARAILLLLEQDLAPAIVSKVMQIGQNPPELPQKLPATELPVLNSDSLFWWGPTTGTTQEGLMHLSQFGWYLSKKDSPTGSGVLYNLNRFNRRFSIEDPPITLPGSADTPNRIYWFSLLSTTGNESLGENSRVVASNVIGLWVECLDRNGVVIPPRSEDPSRPRYNSAERFQVAPAGQEFEDDTTFHYTAATTLQAHALPSSIRFSIMLVDENTLRRNPTFPALPAFTLAKSVTDTIKDYREDLQEIGINAAVYTTTVRLVNAP